MTDYARQRRLVRATITKRGTMVTWYKPGAADTTDPTPEFPELGDAQPYANTPICFFPLSRAKQGTIVVNPEDLTGTQNLYAVIPGDVPFVPEENDGVSLNGLLYHVKYVNITAPDGNPIVYEIGFA